MTDPRSMVQAEGYLQEFLAIVAERKLISCEKAQEWLNVLCKGATEYRMEIQRLNTKIFNARMSLD